MKVRIETLVDFLLQISTYLPTYICIYWIGFDLFERVFDYNKNQNHKWNYMQSRTNSLKKEN